MGWLEKHRRILRGETEEAPMEAPPEDKGAEKRRRGRGRGRGRGHSWAEPEDAPRGMPQPSRRNKWRGRGDPDAPFRFMPQKGRVVTRAEMGAIDSYFLQVVVFSCR